MSDFDAAVDAMFAKAIAEVDEIVHLWLIKVEDFLVIETPGPGNQHEYGPSSKQVVEYIATGVLRQGFDWYASAPPESTSDFGKSGALDDGSFDASATRAKLEGQLGELSLRGELWLWNTIAYAPFVHEGWYTHAKIGPRPFVTQTSNIAYDLYREAAAEVLR